MPEPSTWADDWSGGPDVMPKGRCRFEISPPRHFLFPALVLLLAERPRHGYLLVQDLAELGLGHADRPSMYRALAELEHDDLIRSHTEAPIAGSTRKVYAVTEAGEQALEAWMSIVAQERNSLELVLERYWYCNARRLGILEQIESPSAEAAEATEAVAPAGVDSEPKVALAVGEREGLTTTHGVVLESTTARTALFGATAGRTEAPTRFKVKTSSSRLVIEARSNAGPLAFSTDGLSGWLEVGLRDGLVTEDVRPSAHLEVRVTELRSGNSLFDRELLRRADARRFPVVSVDLRTLERMGEGNCYRVGGDVSFHGTRRRLDGVITVTIAERRQRRANPAERIRRSLVVGGEHLLDVRHFQLTAPAMPLLKLYPDIRLHLHLEADEEAPRE